MNSNYNVPCRSSLFQPQPTNSYKRCTTSSCYTKCINNPQQCHVRYTCNTPDNKQNCCAPSVTKYPSLKQEPEEIKRIQYMDYVI